MQKCLLPSFWSYILRYVSQFHLLLENQESLLMGDDLGPDSDLIIQYNLKMNPFLYKIHKCSTQSNQ